MFEIILKRISPRRGNNFRHDFGGDFHHFPAANFHPVRSKNCLADAGHAHL